jgi:hypothetical protein
MEKLIVTGNGFDLERGLRTRIVDFLDYQGIERPKRYRSNPYFWLAALFDDYHHRIVDFGHWSDIEVVMAKMLVQDNFMVYATKMIERNGIDANAKAYQDDYKLRRVVAHVTSHDHVFEQVRDYLLNELEKIERDLTAFILAQQCDSHQVPDGVKPYFSDNMVDLIKHTTHNLMRELARDDQFDVLNFNYTNPDWQSIDDHAIQYHLHGESYAGSDAHRRIIFGMDDAACDKDKPGYIFTKSYRMIRYFGTLPELGHLQELTQIYRNKAAIEFYGHSFSPSDYTSLENLFDHMNVLSHPMRFILAYPGDNEQYANEGAFIKFITWYCERHSGNPESLLEHVQLRSISEDL